MPGNILRTDDINRWRSILGQFMFLYIFIQDDQRPVTLLLNILRDYKVDLSPLKQTFRRLVQIVTDDMDLPSQTNFADCLGAAGDTMVCHINAANRGVPSKRCLHSFAGKVVIIIGFYNLERISAKSTLIQPFTKAVHSGLMCPEIRISDADQEVIPRLQVLAHKLARDTAILERVLPDEAKSFTV